MSSEQLRASLEALRQELEAPEALGAEDRTLLEQAANDIERVLDEEDATTPDSVRDSFEQAAVSFEVEHPRMARVMGEIVDVLAKMGI